LHVIAPLLLKPLVYAQQVYLPTLLYVNLYVVVYAILPRYLPDIEAFHLPSDRIFFASVEFRSFALQYHLIDRSEERRVGKECRSRWWQEDYKKKAKREQM